MLRIYNSLTRSKQEFTPLEPDAVKMYVCGVTVYDYCHLGHARAYVVWDMVRRYLQYAGYNVRYVQNITDIDDKILNRAKTEGVTMAEISDRFIKAYQEDMARLNILPADKYPRATTSIPVIINLIQALIDQGYAYAAGGDVYYAVQKFPSYGKLSGRKFEDMQAGASGRVDPKIDQTEPLKHYPFDFALWKSAKPNETFWESPWGHGRPGWHIECSAMVKSEFGDRLDIHAGGADLQFPHHENEIAQSEAVTKTPLANYWMHNGFVNIDGEKMSKSLGNFKTIRGLLETYNPMAVRLFILQSHYRTPIDFTEEAINAATKGWISIQEALRFEPDFGTQLNWQKFASTREFSGAIDVFPFDVNWGINLTFNRDELLDEVITRFNEAMDDDFNTAIAISIIYELAKTLTTERNNLIHAGKIQGSSLTLWKTGQTLKYLTAILGFVIDFNLDAPEDPSAISDQAIKAMIEQRKLAKKHKNWAEGDRIRDELKALGITLIDQVGGEVRWHRN
ncbi:cysteinyl-tRNA synthetase [Synechococcus sp. PCC 7502]|uniref:cysteine--tRNA ligase n=1 Tax=Synechococcus sp. PCC 7502 TaxID=1173263 RepID=UPI00029FD18D|nr:cysteine--tRNA ligase [Synechococcus sp. PCC 7502]AFY74874.1 cysteinyl-tRNA synthetase [Synechococcus sp. PCC 7502]